MSVGIRKLNNVGTYDSDSEHPLVMLGGGATKMVTNLSAILTDFCATGTMGLFEP